MDVWLDFEFVFDAFVELIAKYGMSYIILDSHNVPKIMSYLKEHIC